MRFIMRIGLANKPGDQVNPTCYSNVVTRPGPPGWGTGSANSDGGAQARAIVEGLKGRFIAACRQSGREVTNENNFNWVWNRYPGDEKQFGGMRAKYREDVSVTVN